MLADPPSSLAGGRSLTRAVNGLRWTHGGLLSRLHLDDGVAELAQLAQDLAGDA
jgi:hypothetical protein